MSKPMAELLQFIICVIVMLVIIYYECKSDSKSNDNKFLEKKYTISNILVLGVFLMIIFTKNFSLLSGTVVIFSFVAKNIYANIKESHKKIEELQQKIIELREKYEKTENESDKKSEEV